MKIFYTIILSLIIFSSSLAQNMVLSASLLDESKISDNGLYFDGVQGINYEFSPRISPHGDCIDVINGYVFVTWYKGGMDQRNVMLSRKKLNDPAANWVTIEFPHQHIGFQGNPAIGDSHNTAAVAVSTIDNTIHLLYDMHAYSSASYPNDFFNYSVSIKNAAFVPDNQFNLSLFYPKQNFLKSGQNYTLITYPMFQRANDGSLLVSFRYGGSGYGNSLMAHYDGNVWTSNWIFSNGRLGTTNPDRYSLYGSEKFLNGKLYSGFSIRYADNPNYNLNSGLYFAYTNAMPTSQGNAWFDAFGNSVSLPIGIADVVKVAEPGDDFGTATAPRTASDPAFTVTASGAIHFITRVDNINVHYYKASGASAFSKSGGGLIPNPDVRGDIFSYLNHVFMVELVGGKPVIKTTLEGTNNWKIAYSGTDTKSFKHFDAFIENDKLYVYLMENTSGDARPLYLQIFNLTEIEDTTGSGGADIVIEAENFTTASPEVVVGANTSASNGQYISYFSGNKFLEYKFQVSTSGVYDFTLFASNANRDDSTMDILINGVLYSSVPITRSFDWNVFSETVIPNVNLIAGENVVKLTQKVSLSSRPDKLEFKFVSALSASEFEKTKTSIYPNPSKGIFSIKTSISTLNYKLVNLQGQVLEKGVIRQKEINLSNYSKGIYFLELSSGESRLVNKIVIQ